MRTQDETQLLFCMVFRAVFFMFRNISYQPNVCHMLTWLSKTRHINIGSAISFDGAHISINLTNRNVITNASRPLYGVDR